MKLILINIDFCMKCCDKRSNNDVAVVPVAVAFGR